METEILDMIENQTNPTIAPYAKDGEVTLRVTARYEADKDHEDLIGPVVDEIKRRLGSTVYSIDNENLGEVAAKLLINRNMTISLAESCTGGIVAGILTDMPGISKVFDRGIVTYSNRAKIENLGVKPETIEKYGAVSMKTAVEMAERVRKISGTDIGLSITGIAGPDGGTEEKPVGLVYIAISTDKMTKCKELKLWGSRTRIRNVTALNAFDILRRCILGLQI
jgi:nicotinamide-nucleotide amidase